MRPTVAIIGGGISGLAAAYELQARGISFVLLERAPICGGVVRTERIAGYTIDAGPDALLTLKPAALELCRELGLSPRLRPQTNRATFVVRNGHLRELPESAVLGIPTRWWPFVTTRAFSLRGKLRMAAEAFVTPGAGDDESIASFMERRFGREAVDYLAEPLLAGIHGGDPARLSMRAAFPRFLDLESTHGSVIAGLRAKRRLAKSGSPASPFVALPGGMTELTDTLLSRLRPGSIRTGAIVDSIFESPSGYLIKTRDGSRIAASCVMLATPPAATSRLLRSIDPQLAFLCARVRSSSVVTVALGYPRSAVRHPLNGAGLVVPRTEGLSIRALSWVSSKWSGRAPDDRVLLRAYVGGTADPDAIRKSDADIAAAVQRDVAALVGATGEPEITRIYRWPNVTPQLEVGHGHLMAHIDRMLAAHPGLAVSASGFRGTGIADCVADAREQARRIAGRLDVALTA
ncbi:MAG TPA: protoporphyrinogen oxidase [Vicinamibacterales bacterium]